MRQVVIIEDNPVHFKQLQEIISQIDAEALCLEYPNVKAFFNEFRIAGKGNKEERAECGLEIKSIAMIIVDRVSTQSISIDLWQKILSSIDKQEPERATTKFLLTGHDKENIIEEIEDYTDLFIFNYLIKPFDRMIVQQILTMALSKSQGLDVQDLFTYEADKQIEMIKKIEVELLTELGFRTKSSRPIDYKKTSRYFGGMLSHGRQNIFAYSYSNFKRGEGDYVCSFSYAGIANDQLNSIRRSINSSNQKVVHNFEKGNASKKRILIYASNKQLGESLRQFLDEKFNNIVFTILSSKVDILKLLPNDKRSGLLDDKSYQAYSGEGTVTVRISHANNEIVVVEGTDDLLLTYEDLAKIKYIGDIELSPEISLRVTNMQTIVDADEGELQEIEFSNLPAQQIKLESSLEFCLIDDLGSFDLLKNSLALLGHEMPKVILFSEKPLDKYEDLVLMEKVDDIIVTPFDRYYLTRKLKMHSPTLSLKKETEGSRNGITVEQEISTARPVRIRSISEIHLSFYYPRQIRLGDIRKFVLWIPNIKNLPEILAVCRSCQSASGEEYLCDFLFFGISDKHCKQIRQWIKNEFIEDKQVED